MNPKVLEEVIKHIAPQFRYISDLILKRDFDELKLLNKRIKDGIKSGVIIFDHENPERDIDLKKVEKEKGEEFASVLRKQLTILEDIITKFCSKN
jgi:hypothetical protein